MVVDRGHYWIVSCCMYCTLFLSNKFISYVAFYVGYGARVGGAKTLKLFHF
jgi:hypothetical protein